ncbi:methylenetetrahydrofolate reductase [Pseudonocardia sulfidoxydans NBRC 16205]|uniref:Methylenetetrahydrofolate reductase n=2 Tax=Pseudonocardia sulfidoxydans TaxID=54011 RepID=A0A511DFZ6_9PSEU|nr:methylenetetrahydrofolate reductase [Pseudonocardia sulfidoxydans]GEL23702.1 methylenetetrahydrofolate reductase [Pseudonocardia sulfidoxydans NBRC 16205]
MTIDANDAASPLQRRVSELIAAAALEIIPLTRAEGKVLDAPRHTPLTITCSPRFGLERTAAHVESAVGKGYRVVPHLAARMVADEGELRAFVTRMRDLGVDDLYVIGGDADEPVGTFGSAVELLDALQGFDHGMRRIGVGCYPEGHPKIADETLIEALLAKQVHASYMVSQLCFDSEALVRWVLETRSAGVTLPLRIGMAAPIRTTRLAELSLRIGVGQSLRFLAKQHGMVGNLLLGRTYAPEVLLRELGEQLSNPELGVEGLHIFTFNQVDVTVAWQNRFAREVC